ncbi:hypothetical protein FPK15_contig00138-0001 [Flavobacterium psychrophilum]|nr:hypothetical protein FPK15_contig00138-0001 [Flavobacterium psychrophilum]
MKAIHNALVGINESIFVGNYKLKYNFESNSQLARPKMNNCTVGNYKLKYNFESNSQRNFKIHSIYKRW